jgi:hypothetical protein
VLPHVCPSRTQADWPTEAEESHWREGLASNPRMCLRRYAHMATGIWSSGRTEGRGE